MTFESWSNDQSRCDIGKDARVIGSVTNHLVKDHTASFLHD